MSSTEEEARAASEQMNFTARLIELEEKYATMEKDREVWYAKAKASDELLASLEKEKNSLEGAVLTLKTELTTTKAELQLEQTKTHEVASEGTLNLERANRIEAEADKLREEISILTESKKELLNQVSEWETKAKLNDSAAVPLQYEVERLKKELDHLSAHSKWLQEELTNRNSELVRIKTTHSEAMMHIRQELDQTIDERDEGVNEVSRLANSKSDLERQVEKLSKELRATREEAVAATEAANREVQAERKLVQLQKEQLDRISSRHRRLEGELEGLRQMASKASTQQEDAMEEMRAEIQQEANKLIEEQHIAFRKEITRLKGRLTDAERIEHISSPFKDRSLLTVDNAPMGLTDVYARLNQVEDELHKERSECKKWKLYNQRIEAEIAAKTPVIMRQRKEYEMTLERMEEMQERLLDSLRESKECKEEVMELKDEMGSIERINRELMGENKDLAKQVQVLLASKAGSDVSTGVPTSIVEMQQQNQQILGEHRRLVNEVDELQRKLRDDPKIIRLEDAERELETLRENQTRQEILVASIAQQRDLYRALLSKQDGTPVDVSGTELVVAEHSEAARAAEDRCKCLERDLAKAEADLIVMKGDKQAMLERVDRATAHANELTVSVEKLENIVLTANSAAARSEADASYHREKCSRVENNLEEIRDELKRMQHSKKQIQATNVQLHQQLELASAQVSKSETDLREVKMKLRLAQTQTETSKSAEARLLNELNNLRTELSRQGALLESVQKIEATLSARSEEERDKLTEQIDRLNQQLDQERLKQGINTENSQNRLKELEMELKEASRKKEQAMHEAMTAKEEALVATTARQQLLTKIARLESELGSALNRLGQTSADSEEVPLQTKIETLTQQLEEAKTEVESWKERCANFQNVAKTSEKELTALISANETYQQSKVLEIEDLKNKIENMKTETLKKDEMIVELTRDLSSQRDEQKTAEDTLREQIAGMQSKVATAKKDAEAAIVRAAGLQAEMQKYQTDAADAQRNYERELELHALASKDLRAAREEIASEQRIRTAAQEHLKHLKFEIAGKERQLEEEKVQIVSNLKVVEESLQQTRSQNEALLSQLETLGDQVEKAQAERIDAASGDASSDEVETLRKSVSELREVVKFMRAEREMNRAQLDASLRTAERERAATTITLRSLEEARAELKVFQASMSADSDSNALQMRLKQADEQIAVLRDSNKLLRDESKKVQEIADAMKHQLAEEKGTLAPLQSQQQNLLLEKAALVSEKESLQRELQAWKSRVQSLVSKFNQIDPEEHDKVLKEAEALKKECANLTSEKDNATKESASAKFLVSKLNKDLTQQKAMFQKQQSLLQKMKLDKDAATKSSSANTITLKERDELKQKLQKVETEFASTKTELKGANDRIEMLKQRMRQFQKIISDQRRKISDLESNSSTIQPSTLDMKAQAPAAAPPLAHHPLPVQTKPAQPTTSTEEKAAGNSQQKLSEQKDETKPQDNASKPEVPSKTLTDGVIKDPPPSYIPAVPTGGFKFGPSSASGLSAAGVDVNAAGKRGKIAEKDEMSKPEQSQISPAPASEAPAAKKTKLDDKSNEETKKDIPSGEGSPGKQAVSDDAKAHQAALKEKLKLKQQEASEKLRGLKQAQVAKEMAAEALKDKLRKRKAERQEADQQAQKRASTDEEEQMQIEKEFATEATAFSEKSSGLLVAKEPAEISKQTASTSKEIDGSAFATKNETTGGAPKITSREAMKAVLKEISKEAPKNALKEISKDESKESVKDAPKEAVQPSFGSGTPFGAGFGSKGSTAFGTTGFGKPMIGGGITFGSSSSVGGFGSIAAPTSTGGSSTFLDMKPPSSSAAPFSFGSGSSIKLPTPTIAPPIGGAPSPFGAFTGTNPFGGPAATSKPLFGKSSSVVEPVATALKDKESKAEDEEVTTVDKE